MSYNNKRKYDSTLSHEDSVVDVVASRAHFQDQRSLYRPSIPLVLQGLFDIHEEKVTHDNNNISCEELFPHTYNNPKVELVSHSGDSTVVLTSGKKIKVGILFSGGPAPGGHNVLTGCLDFLKSRNLSNELIGFLAGPDGLIKNANIIINKNDIQYHRNLGGFNFLGTGRTKIETEEQLRKSMNTCISHNLHGLIVIGGDDSNTNAAVLAEFFKANDCSTCVIGIPKTIDGDMRGQDIEASFGFDSATKVYSEMIANICSDAASSLKSYHFTRVMGRDASHITLEVALQTHPNLVFISEELERKQATLLHVVDEIVEMVVERAKVNKHYGVILIPEGLLGFLTDVKILIHELNEICADKTDSLSPSSFDTSLLSPEALELYSQLPDFIVKQMLAERDPHGNLQVSVIETERLLGNMARKRLDDLKSKGKFDGKFNWYYHYFGFEGRCSFPTKFDSDYCYTLGSTAGALIECGYTSMVATVKNLAKDSQYWIPGGTPMTSLIHLERRRGKVKPVIKKKLVDLDDAPMRTLNKLRKSWLINDEYRLPGPIQHGATASNDVNFTLLLESAARDDRNKK